MSEKRHENRLWVLTVKHYQVADCFTWSKGDVAVVSAPTPYAARKQAAREAKDRRLRYPDVWLLGLSVSCEQLQPGKIMMGVVALTCAQERGLS